MTEKPRIGSVRTALEVLTAFRRTHGLLMAGAIAYYTLLSLVPLFALLLIGLSHVVDERRLIATTQGALGLLVPGRASAITDQVSVFLAHRNVVGWVGAVSLLFFSAMAFGVLETAMARVFHHRSAPKRHPIVSALIPYAFVVVLGFGLLVVTLITGAIEMLGRSAVHVVGHALPLATASRALLHLLGTGGLALLLTALYMVLPAQRISLRAAARGAIAATLLWEVVRRLLVWYFASVSMVNVIYGSLATAVVLLATLEAASIILLLGAEVVATLERRARVGMEPFVSAHDSRVSNSPNALDDGRRSIVRNQPRDA